AVPSDAGCDRGRDLAARDQWRALASPVVFDHADRNGVDPRDDCRGHRRLCDRAFQPGARGRHHLHLGAVSDSEDRAAAAADPVAGWSRGGALDQPAGDPPAALAVSLTGLGGAVRIGTIRRNGSFQSSRRWLMNVGDERTKSIWADTAVAPEAAQLGHDIEADTLVVGSGIAGLSAA